MEETTWKKSLQEHERDFNTVTQSVHPDDVADWACQLRDMAQDIEEHIEDDDLVKASDCARNASLLLSRIMVGITDLCIMRKRRKV